MNLAAEGDHDLFLFGAIRVLKWGGFDRSCGLDFEAIRAAAAHNSSVPLRVRGKSALSWDPRDRFVRCVRELVKLA